jgi:hypothetical protein
LTQFNQLSNIRINPQDSSFDAKKNVDERTFASLNAFKKSDYLMVLE